MTTRASIIVPTRDRPAYLETALASIAPQAAAAGCEVIVVDDAGGTDAAAIAGRHGARHLRHDAPRGPNAARNTGIEAARAQIVVLVDDDVEAPEGWLEALLAAAEEHSDIEVFGGPIRARLEAFRRRTCGREGAPVTELDLGPEDRAADFVWSANMAIRRSALDRTGAFDPTLDIYGDEEEWQRRYRAAGGRIRYVAAAVLVHRRAPEDATLRALSRGAYVRGRNSRRFDERKGSVPPFSREVWTLLATATHVVRHRCAFGVPMTAAAWGRVREAARKDRSVPEAAGANFLSGSPGVPWRRRAVARDALADAALALRGVPRRLDRAARHEPPRRSVLVLGVERTDVPSLMAQARAELERSRHDVEVHVAPAGGAGKFENLNALLERHPPAGRDWLLLVDDDVALPRGFLDRFLFLAERFALRLAQPAHRHRSHAAWELTRRRAGALVRQTAFVEIGPVVALHADTFDALLPLPDLRMGWGLDAHWAAVAREHGWRVGVVDAVPIRHLLRPIATGYAIGGAVDEARAFLAQRPYLAREESQRTLATHRSW